MPSPRLPVPGQDNGTWGAILNEYLSVEHNSDGSLKIRTDGTLSAGVPDADSTTKGKVQLAGDLSGTAAAPTVASGAIDNTKISPLANIDQSKLNLAITNSQIAVGAAIDQSKVALDSDLTAIAGLSPSNDDIIQRKAGAWINRTPSQLKADLAITYSKSVAVESPTNSENITLFHTDTNITITKVHAVLRGSTPSVTFQLSHGTDRSDAGTNLFGSNQTLSGAGATVAGTEYTSFSDATLVADEMIWLRTSATSGTVDEMSVTIYYVID